MNDREVSGPTGRVPLSNVTGPPSPALYYMGVEPTLSPSGRRRLGVRRSLRRVLVESGFG